MGGGDRFGIGVILMIICVIAFGMLAGLAKAVTENPGWSLLGGALIVIVWILRKKDMERVNRNSAESRSSRRKP